MYANGIRYPTPVCTTENAGHMLLELVFSTTAGDLHRVLTEYLTMRDVALLESPHFVMKEGAVVVERAVAN